MPFLTSPISIRLDGRRLLRADPVRRGGLLRLCEADGTEIDPRIPIAALLTREDLASCTRQVGAELIVFREGERRFRLRLRRRPGGAELIVVSPDGAEHDAHHTPISALFLP